MFQSGGHCPWWNRPAGASPIPLWGDRQRTLLRLAGRPPLPLGSEIHCGHFSSQTGSRVSRSRACPASQLGPRMSQKQTCCGLLHGQPQSPSGGWEDV